MSGSPAHIRADRWLSETIGREAYRVEVAGGLPSAAELAAVCANPKAFLYSKVAVADLESVKFLESQGFNLVDTSVAFEKKATRVAHGLTGLGVRFTVPADRDGVAAVAGESFVYSRFHLDKAIPRVIADRVKAAWVTNFYTGGRGDHMVVATDGVRPIGFLQLLEGKDGVLTIDLIASAAGYRGRGVARAMVQFAENEIPGVQRVRVGTQVANSPSIRFYENYGFRMSDASYVFHFHGKAGWA